MAGLGLHIPSFQRRVDSSRKFKLSIKVLAGSIPGLETPGVASQLKPFLEARLGGKSKATEFADFAGDGRGSGMGAHSCPWRFGDELSFTLTAGDVKGPGVRLKLRVQKELGFGPLRVEPCGPADAGEGSLDLRSRGLPACVQETRSPAGGGSDGDIIWCSPMILVPLAHVVGGACVPSGPGEPVAHIALILSVDTDPEDILVAAGVRPPPPLVDTGRLVEDAVAGARAGSETVGKRLKDAECGLEEQIASVRRSVSQAASAGLEEAERTLEPARRSLEAALGGARARSQSLQRHLRERGLSWSPRASASRAAGDSAPSTAKPAQPAQPAQPWSPQSVEALLVSPQLDQQGWVCHEGPSGQQYWHHRSLGPAPWELAPSAFAGCQGGADAAAESPSRSAREPPGPAAREAPPRAPERSRTMSVDLPLAGSPLDAGPHARRAAPPAGPVLPSPDEAPENWVLHRRADGRTFWHNTALGPPPWEPTSCDASPPKAAAGAGASGSSHLGGLSQRGQQLVKKGTKELDAIAGRTQQLARKSVSTLLSYAA